MMAVMLAVGWSTEPADHTTGPIDNGASTTGHDVLAIVSVLVDAGKGAKCQLLDGARDAARWVEDVHTRVCVVGVTRVPDQLTERDCCRAD
jgi:hypothetical protein